MIFAFSGPAGSGKTTAANALKLFGVKVHSFAAPLKYVANLLYVDKYGNPPMSTDKEREVILMPSLSDLTKYTERVEEVFRLANSSIIGGSWKSRVDWKAVAKELFDREFNSAREAYQEIGQIVRSAYADRDEYSVWELFMEDTLYHNTGTIAIDDVRFPKEEELISRYRNVHLHLDRPGTEVRPHVSESYLGYMKEHADKVLSSDKEGSVLDFQTQVLRTFLEFFSKHPYYAR